MRPCFSADRKRNCLCSRRHDFALIWTNHSRYLLYPLCMWLIVKSKWVKWKYQGYSIAFWFGHRSQPHPSNRPSIHRYPRLRFSGNPWIWPAVWRYKNVSVTPYQGSRIWWVLRTFFGEWNQKVHTSFFEPPLAITKHGTRSRYKLNSSLYYTANNNDVNVSSSASNTSKAFH